MCLRVLSAVILLVLMATLPVHAHRQNESYVYFNVSDDALTGRIEARFVDIDQIIPLDSDGNGEIAVAEFIAKADEVSNWFLESVTILSGGTGFPLDPGEVTVLDTPQGNFAQIGFSVNGLSPVPEAVELRYISPLNEVLPGHLGYALIESNDRTGVTDNESHFSLIFQSDGGLQTLSLVAPPWQDTFAEFVVHGIWHIWLGFDHVIFLLTLLLPAVMVRRPGAWEPVPDFRTALMNVLKLVTVFTLSHSVTLSLSALGIFQLPVAFVEWVIAFSIIFVALGNIFPSFQHQTLIVVFIFGLFHGFGFANVLAPLGVNPSAKLVGLAGFNVGVEIGQIAIVAVVFPVLFALRRWRAYPFLALRMASVCFILLAGVWLYERSTGMIWRLQKELLSSGSGIGTVASDAAHVG